ncbi:MAG: MFS transporter [Alteromonas macleodii]|jgi:PAT family beta-lactamase induction signal transducer AmpG|uniref:Muropeptide transport protein n=1 Tax=Alteromonas macleodii (strain English Channel 673) TaxID=1004788 RepID=A0AB32ZVA5_ALTME|nr:MFS transporter [Alteromonas macleodii]AFT73249.1 putative muropeptide transport protein [Alteromonas macleodii str. 'English Channel 673']AMN10611.1 MFS transporter [Alteromonas macleodii]MCZ4242062.1 MFS transporter [Alteromonas macleodii]MDM7962573.1 MFS transporter [Alteromonas macleodii]MDM8171071.1 MFS transporter [Alteromonas macleodii]|tara:strand:- start:528 stop:1874 length:1347 start_codon:yes stop_codon:yes gene_type:complete
MAQYAFVFLPKAAVLLNALKTFNDKRYLSIFLFGISSGFPWIMIGSVLSAWLKDEGLSRSAIGLFGIIFATYSFNFLWSPLVDKIKPPLLGQRRGWIFAMQGSVVLLCLVMSQLTADQDLFYVALIGLLIAIASATQDIAIDGFRIDCIAQDDKDGMSAASSVATAGWWTGYGGLGAIPFFLADMTSWTWPNIYLLLGALMALLMCATCLANEPQIDREALLEKITAKDTKQSPVFHWIQTTLVTPFAEFFNRNGVKLAASFLLFIFLFKIGEAFLGRMSIVFYKEIGFSNSDIATYSKLLNWWVTIVFSLLGGLVNIRYGIYRGLMIAGVAMAASNLLFALIAQTGPSTSLLAITVIVDGFTGAWSTVAMVAFISLLCNRAFSATQYALMASLSVAGRTLVASSSGFVVDSLEGNWSLFFILTAVMVIPSLCFLYSIRHHIKRVESP